MENRFGAPASGTPEERSARREFELLLLLGGSRKAAVQLWKWERRQRKRFAHRACIAYGLCKTWHAYSSLVYLLYVRQNVANRARQATRAKHPVTRHRKALRTARRS